jgi:hypothetical protein
MRYAHPFFTQTPPAERPADFSAFGQRMASWIATDLGPIPPPRTASSVLDLASVLGETAVREIADSGAIKFHAVGDTGRADDNSDPEAVSRMMSSDYTVGDDAHNPAFFFHLGDVIYGPNKENAYRNEFYWPYMRYPGKIIAIPGNHDGEIYQDTDPVSLKAFRDNFCTETPELPPIASDVRIFRQTMIQPGVYHLLRAPFVDIVALYSNSAEGQGSIVGGKNRKQDIAGANKDEKQKQWLTTTLKNLSLERKSARKALLFTTHHPPYSDNSEHGHGGSPNMLKDLDDACADAGIWPDAVLSGHAHSYQRYTRYLGEHTTPFIVAGCGGHNLEPVGKATGQRTGDHSYDKSLKDFGYLLITVSTEKLHVEFYALNTQPRRYDAVEVNLGAP